MILHSLPSLRASATLVFALALTGCFSSHPCPRVTEDTLTEGHLDYAFNDGTQTSVDITSADTTESASALNGNVVVTWKAPLSATAGDVASLFLSIKMPDADGSFDLDTLSAEVCACQSGFVSRSEDRAECVTAPGMTRPPAECQPVTGHLEIHRMAVGICGANGGCPDLAVELLLTSPAEKGLSGNFTFLHTTTRINASCVDFPLDIG